MAVLDVRDVLRAGDPLERARALAPVLRERAAEGEDLRTMPPDLVELVEASGLFGMHLPRALGGLEVDLPTQLDVVEELAAADGSAAWTIVIGASTGFAAWLDPDVAAALLDGRGASASASMWGPMGAAVPDGEGGYVVSGRWPFCSGSPHARWFQLAVFQVDQAGDVVGVPLAFLRRDQVEVVETWDGAGLRGTGSHDVVVEGARVPAALLPAVHAGPARHDGPLYRFAVGTAGGALMAAFALGVARRALDEAWSAAAATHRGGSPTSIAADGFVQHELAACEGALLAARAGVRATVAEAWATAEAGEDPAMDQRVRMALARTHASRTAVDVTSRVARLLGARAAGRSHPVQRCARDLATSAQHIIVSAGVDQQAAQHLLGMDVPPTPAI